MNTQFDALREQAEHYEKQKKYVQALMLYKTIPDLPEYDENMKQIICDKICNIGDELLKETKGIPIKTQRVKHFWGLQRRKKFLARRSFKKAANTFKIHIPPGYKKLLKVYEKALKIDPSYPPGYKKVLKVYEEALKIDPYYSQAVYQIAYTYLHLKDYQEAARWFRDYCDVAEQSEYASALRKICDIGDIFYKQQKKITKAIRTYKKILEIVPEYEKTFSIESPIYFETPDQGIEPEYVRAFEALGTIYFDAGDYENASDIYIRYCELEQYNNEAALHRLIEICDKYYQKKEYRHSIELYERIIRSIREGRGDIHSEYYKDFLFSLANFYYESNEYDNKKAITLYLEIFKNCAEILREFEKEEICTRLENIYSEIAERAQYAKLSLLKSELVEQRAELEQARQLAYLGTMATAVAHEINQPVGIIRAATDAALLDLQDDLLQIEELGPLLRRIWKQTERLHTIIENFRKFARGDRTTREDVNLNQLVEQTASLFSEQLTHHHIALRLQLYQEPPAPLVFANRFQLEEALINVLSNARDAVEGRENAAIWLTTWCDPHKDCGFVVEDNGPGLSAEYRKHLFMPFMSTKSTEQGTGLGLYLARKIIQDFGGALCHEDRSGGGARFIVRFPIEKE